MAAQQQTLKQIYEERKSEPGIGTDKITTDAGRSRATPFSIDASLQIDESVVTTQWLNEMRSSKGLVLNTVEYSATVDKNA